MARVYQTAHMGEAHLRVAIVAAQGQADLLVHRVGSWGMASGDALQHRYGRSTRLLCRSLRRSRLGQAASPAGPVLALMQLLRRAQQGATNHPAVIASATACATSMPSIAAE